ncbi:hypothetical protein [Ruegeria atlantica]|uniref:hypothetical protein n=1 Tax=Ruegeria atlantica TaxID=81569 RepID=UPI001479C8CB|nr:hypothetical protein [Ruegeria atlantica]
MTKAIRAKEFDSASILEAYPDMSEEGQKTVRMMLSFKGEKTWKGLQVVPPGSIADEVVDIFKSESDIPLELPLMIIFLSILGI